MIFTYLVSEKTGPKQCFIYQRVVDKNSSSQDIHLTFLFFLFEIQAQEWV